MKTKLIPIALIFLILLLSSCSNPMEQTEKIDKLDITVRLSDSYANHLLRLISVNKLKIYLEYFNNSDETVIFQVPINQWNLFLTVLDVDNQKIDTNNLKFITPVIDESIYIELQPKEKKIFEFLVSDFGSYKVNYNKVKKFIINHIPQNTDCNMHDNGLILNEFTLEYSLR